MGLFRKSLSISTLGAIDFRSDKERIARSARLGVTASQETNRLLNQQNKLIAQANHSISADRRWDFTYDVPADDLWTMVTGALSKGHIRSRDDVARTIEVTSNGCAVAASVGGLTQTTGSGLRLRARAAGYFTGAASDQKVQAEWSRLVAAIERQFPVSVRLDGATSKAPAKSTSEDLVGQLSSLADLHAAGALTDQQYEVAKEKLLG